MVTTSAHPSWQARTKQELMIEAWEWLDCETVGEKELRAVADAVQEHFGAGAVDSPAIIARTLADEGAELRYPEVMALDVAWRTADKYAAMFRNVLKFSDFQQAAQSLQRLENLRCQFERTQDREGLRRLRELALEGRKRLRMIAGNEKVEARKRAEKAEIEDWFRIWLTAPQIFADWLDLRQKSDDFQQKFAP